MMALLVGLLKQTAVYWPPEDGYDDFGQPTVSSPQELICRWEDTAEEFIDAQGTKTVSKAQVFLDEDVEVKGLLMLGTLAEAEASDFPTDPKEAGALEIRSFQKTPRVKGTAFVRSVYL